MIHLHTHVTSRTRTIEDVHFHILCLSQRSSCLLTADTQIGLGHLRQRCQSSLEIILVTLQLELEVGCQRFVAKGTDEDGFRLGFGVGGNSIRQLVDITEETSLEECLLDSLAIELSHILLAIINILLFLISLHLHA